MSPIVTTMSAPAGRGRRVPGPAGGGGGGGGSSSYGPGPNAPAWSGKTIYTEQRFTSPIPEGGAADAAGFKLVNGYGNAAPDGNRISYPTVTTPLGDKAVMRMTFRGQTENITANGQTTTAWPFNPFEYWNASVYITGTWSGALVFETSPDGTTWTTTTLPNGGQGDDSITSPNASSTTINGLWAVDTGTGDQFVRVRASSWTSGTAVVRIGVRGGQAPANFQGGTWTAAPTRIYQRVLWRFSENWSDGNNAGTKFFFFSSDQGNNHYVAGNANFAGLQASANANYQGSTVGTPFGSWWDCEQIFTSGTAGGSDGTIQLWVNGVQVLNQTGVPMFANGTTPGFVDLYYNPTYGGGQRPAPANQYIDYAYMYRESAA